MATSISEYEGMLKQIEEEKEALQKKKKKKKKNLYDMETIRRRISKYGTVEPE